jgi:hypothetical protein
VPTARHEEREEREEHEDHEDHEGRKTRRKHKEGKTKEKHSRGAPEECGLSGGRLASDFELPLEPERSESTLRRDAAGLTALRAV